MDDFPKKLTLPFFRTKQKHDWDCGLACATSILRGILDLKDLGLEEVTQQFIEHMKIHSPKILNFYLMNFLEKKEKGKKSYQVLKKRTRKLMESMIKKNMKKNEKESPTIEVWSIFLFHFLRVRYSVNCLYSTITFGAEHSENDFYKEHFSTYSIIVDSFFFYCLESPSMLSQNLSIFKDRIHKLSFTEERLKEILLQPELLLIVLINSVEMNCLRCDKKTIISEEDKKKKEKEEEEEEYYGHFIVVISYDKEKDEVLFLNSNIESLLVCGDDYCRCPFEEFQKARIHSCTDEDIIIVSLKKDTKNNDINQWTKWMKKEKNIEE